MGYPSPSQPWSSRGLIASVIFAIIVIGAILLLSAVLGAR
jgi:hypothetical protein